MHGYTPEAPKQIDVTKSPDGAPLAPADDPSVPWYKLLTRYHWFVLVVCVLGWMLDCMDQQLFNLARKPAMQALVGGEPQKVEEFANYATAIFLVGWGVGGVGFGIIADLFGRARAMIFTILLYSVFTGLSAASQGFWDFALYRFLTGLGVGGQFAVGVSLVAEEIPDRARPFALGWLQALSALGNVTAALIQVGLAFLVYSGTVEASWRLMFVVGTVPAVLVIFIMRRLREPEKWRKLAAEKTIRERMGAYSGELFRDPRWTRNAIVGLVLASAGIIGLWAIGFFTIDLTRSIFAVRLHGLEEKDRKFWNDIYAALTSVMFNIGAFFGIYAFSRFTHRVGRRTAFAISLVLAGVSTAFVYWKLSSVSDIFWMVPIMGFCQLALFGGYAIYFPELFPTRLRSTGTSVCYNGARFVAAAGLFFQGSMVGYFKRLHDGDTLQAARTGGMVMCLIFLVGLLVLPFAPETKGKPLPE
jgi:MFS family permease